MSNIEDMELALQCQVPKQSVPIWDLEFHCWDQASGKHVYLGREFEQLTPTQQDRAIHSNAEIMVDVATDLGFSALTVPSSYWEIAPGKPAYYWLPDVARYKQVESIYKLASSHLMLIGISSGVFGMPSAETFVDFSLKLFDAPEEVDEIFRNTFRHGIECAKKLRDAGVKAVVNASDIAHNGGLFYSPQQMDKLFLPFLNNWANRLKEMGLYAILHTDGRIYACLEELADSGINALQAIDPVAGMDMRAVKEQMNGRI